MPASLLSLVEFIGSMRSVSALLSTHIDDLSEINKKEPENEFIDNMRSMSASLSSLIDDVSEINKKILLIELIDKLLITFALLLRKGIYPI